MYDYVTYVVCNFMPYYRACYYVSVIMDWYDIWINILIESSLLAYEMCQVILLMLCSIVWYVYHFLNTVLMGFDRYRCVLDCIFPFSKLPEYRRRFCFQKYHTVFVFDEKMWKWKWWVFRRCFRPFSSHSVTVPQLPRPHSVPLPAAWYAPTSPSVVSATSACPFQCPR